MTLGSALADHRGWERNACLCHIPCNGRLYFAYAAVGEASLHRETPWVTEAGIDKAGEAEKQHAPKIAWKGFVCLGNEPGRRHTSTEG
jgi:hypothetical protein